MSQGNCQASFFRVCQCPRRVDLLCRYNTHNTPSQLGLLTDGKLKGAGVDDKDVRKLVLAAIRKSGYRGPAAGPSSRGAAQNNIALSAADPPTASTSAQAEVRGVIQLLMLSILT